MKKIRRGAFRIWMKPKKLGKGEINGSLMTSDKVINSETFEASYVHAVPIHWEWQVRPVSRVSLEDIEALEPIVLHTDLDAYKQLPYEAPSEKVERAKHRSLDLAELEAS